MKGALEMTVVLAATAAAVFGCSDFLGGLASRQASARTVSFVSQLFGLAALIVALIVLNAPVPPTSDFAYGAVAGAFGGLGVLALYAALAVGRMGIVAPVTAALAAALPAAFDIVRGADLGVWSGSGIVLAIVAVVIVSMTPVHPDDAHLHDAHAARRALVFALIAGTSFAAFFTLLSFTDPDAGLWPLLGARFGSIPLLGLFVVIGKQKMTVPRRALPATVGAGVLDMVANVALLLALQIGPLAIAAVASSLYPVSTVLLARAVLKERLHGWQRIGVVLALVAVVLMALP